MTILEPIYFFILSLGVWAMGFMFGISKTIINATSLQDFIIYYLIAMILYFSGTYLYIKLIKEEYGRSKKFAIQELNEGDKK